MSTEQQRIAEAITDVTRVLRAEGAPEAERIADELIKGLMRDGWRPRGPRAELPTGMAHTRATPDTAHRTAEQIREDIRRAKERG